MRVRLLHAWPALSHHFGIKPTDIYGMTPAELDAYLDALADINDGR